MVEVVEKVDVMADKLDRVITMKPMPRVERLKEAYFGSKFTGDISWVRISTRVMKETEGEPMVTRKAKAFAAVVREVPINILPDELFVGYIASILKGEFLGCFFGPDLERTLDTMPFVSDEDKRELREEIFPYWRGPQGKYERTTHGLTHQRYPREIKELLFIDPEVYPGAGTGIVYTIRRYGRIHHNTPNFEKVLKKGFLGIKKEAEERLNRFDLRDPHTNPDELRKVPFLEGVIMAMEAAAEIGERFAAKARELAEEEEDTKRKAELLKIAEVCDQVPAKPARTFYEALQSLWLVHILHWWESGRNSAISPGRVDQYLYPYYESDIREGRITKEEAQELLDCWFIKFGTALHLPTVGYGYKGVAASHNDINPNIQVGGLTAGGQDASNELSYMLIEAMMHTRLTNPPLGVRVHSKTPDALLIKACQLLSLGTGHPAFYNDECLVPLILGRANLGPWPVTLEQARMCTLCGCFEPEITGEDSGCVVAGGFNLAAALEFVLTNGWNRFYHKKMGVETGDPRQFKSFEEVQEAYKRQVAWLMGNLHIPANIEELVMAEMEPTLYQSALIGDCIEKGICREAGGTRYNYRGLSLGGANDVANSLAAIKKLVFEDKKITMDQLCDALDRNFEGYDELRQMLLKVPKFGNDDDYVDELGAWVWHETAEEVKKYPNTRGGYTYIGQVAGGGYVGGGKVIGALPSGRLAGEPLADGIGATLGSDVNGPTAVLKSAGKINNAEIGNGTSLNMRIAPALFKEEDGFKRMADLIRVLIDQKIFQVMINVVSSDTMRAAQKEPDKYKDLVVKVAGWNAFFVDLEKPLQDEIIARSEYGL